ncbi:hypothetical protein [Janthinobacterium sp. B9-8]|uniref:hypothetical protein n=1 Tax=Janthinobacterium sp. B9-8 TaxID=1236179 RepID=UPI00061CF81B|nr:hypothetical protein [Janthinobacterium sp. B9-8]AMC35711.1 hypothetical protein VN23_14380 [Janthinobacterium sp. B9-8]
MAEWSVWKALEQARQKKRDLDPLFARAGIAPELATIANRICLDLKRAPPTLPLLTGDKTRDAEAMGMYYEGYARQYEEAFYKAENLLRFTWVPEAAPIGSQISAEILRLRDQLKNEQGKTPDFSMLEGLLFNYVRLDHPELELAPDLLSNRRRELTDVAGYPLLVQHAHSETQNDSVPPLLSEAFKVQLSEHLQRYLASPWLHCPLITQWYVTLALDTGLARKKHDALDDQLTASLLKRRWPSLSNWMPQFEFADQCWYVSLSLLALVSLFMEWWWLAAPMVIWLHLSLGAHRRERKEVEDRRAFLLGQAQMLKRTRDRFGVGLISLEKLAFQLRHWDEKGEYFEPQLFDLLALHQHEA